VPCYHPLKGWRSHIPNPKTGKRPIVFSSSAIGAGEELHVPCGRCIGCRLERSRQWALRCVHEASLYQRNCFITLTYSPENLPFGGSLDYEAPVLFMKRLRKRFGKDIRSYGCAEYGENFSRPHYHLILFNFDFDDRCNARASGDFFYYESPALQELWTFGFSSVCDFSFDTAAYVARYVTKKITGGAAEKHYENIDYSTGEVFPRLSERSVCISRRPGIGRGWYDKFGQYSRDHDKIIFDGKAMKPPLYYDKLFDVAFPVDCAKTKANRKSKALAFSLSDEATDRSRKWKALSRLAVKERCHELKFYQLLRRYEDV
jgi:hypothetical protein